MRSSRIRRIFTGDLSVIWMALFVPICTLPDFLATMSVGEAIGQAIQLTAIVLFFGYEILLITEPLDH